MSTLHGKGVTLNMNTSTLNEVIAYDYTDGELLHNPHIAQTACKIHTAATYIHICTPNAVHVVL